MKINQFNYFIKSETYYSQDQLKKANSGVYDTLRKHEHENTTHDQYKNHSIEDFFQINNTSFHQSWVSEIINKMKFWGDHNNLFKYKTFNFVTPKYDAEWIKYIYKLYLNQFVSFWNIKMNTNWSFTCPGNIKT